jgi:hypothetical protein
MDPTPIACRVASRHRAAVIPARARLEYSSGGRISAIELTRMLEPDLGMLTELRFRRSLRIQPNAVEWEALDENASVVTGRLVLHAAVSESQIVSWAEVVVDEDRDTRAALRVATRYMRDSGGLVPVDEEGDEPFDDEGEQMPVRVLGLASTAI